jgi:hypothetical protein
MSVDYRSTCRLFVSDARKAVSESLDAARAAVEAAERALNATHLPSDTDLYTMQYQEGGYRATRKLRNRSKRNNKKKGKSRRAAK